MPVAKPAVLQVTIPNGQSLSDAAEIGEGVLVALQVPTLTNAALTFQISHDGVTYQNAFDTAQAEITIPASTGARFIQAPATLSGAPFIKVRSGTSGAPVAQGADRVFQLVAK